jgi:hypothetical protein
MAEECFFCGIRLGICKTYGILTGYISLKRGQFSQNKPYIGVLKLQ